MDPTPPGITLGLIWSSIVLTPTISPAQPTVNLWCLALQKSFKDNVITSYKLHYYHSPVCPTCCFQVENNLTFRCMMYPVCSNLHPKQCAYFCFFNEYFSYLFLISQNAIAYLFSILSLSHSIWVISVVRIRRSCGTDRSLNFHFTADRV